MCANIFISKSPIYFIIMYICIHLKSKNELIIIKEYIELRSYFLIFPILTLFIFIEYNKNYLSNNIENIKLNLLNSKNLGDTKILISSDGNKKKYTIFSSYDENKGLFKQYLNFETQNETIYKGEISTNIYFNESDLFSNYSTIFEDNHFRNINFNRKLFENFTGFFVRKH